MHGLDSVILLGTLAFLFGFFLLGWVGFGRILKVKHGCLFSAASLPVFLALVFAFYSYRTRGSAVFEDAFGFAAPASVKFENSSYFRLGDCGYTFLRFKADWPVVKRMVDSRGLPFDRTSWRHHINPDSAPDWWNPPSGEDIYMYTGRFTDREFAIEKEVLVHDLHRGETYYGFLGID